MDTEAAALLTTAGTTVVALMATDAWKQTRDGLVRLWRRFRPEHAEAIGRELTASRAVVASALARGDAEPETPLGRLWAQELRELLADPHAARELRALLLACKQAAPGNDGSPSRSQRTEARAEGHARSYAAGHDMTIIEGASGDQVVHGGLHIHQVARDRDSGIENAVILTVDYRRPRPDRAGHHGVTATRLRLTRCRQRRPRPRGPWTRVRRLEAPAAWPGAPHQGSAESP